MNGFGQAVTSSQKLARCIMSNVKFQMSNVRWQMSNVKCQMKNAKFQMSIRLNLLSEHTSGVSPVILSFFKLKKEKKENYDFAQWCQYCHDEEWALSQLIYRSSVCHIIGRFIILKEIKDQTLHLHWPYCFSFVQTSLSPDILGPNYFWNFKMKFKRK